MTEVRLTIPLPPKQLSPNARCHWIVKAKAIKAYRTSAWAAAIEAMRGTGERWPEATAAATFVVRQNRRRDRDNALASLKAAWDGIRDAGVVEDDSGLTFEPIQFKVEKRAEWPKGCVEITIKATKTRQNVG